MKLWLDDLRPAPEGWVAVTTTVNAMALLSRKEVDELSLDYDMGRAINLLGACDICTGLGPLADTSRCPRCQADMPTGLDLIRWMDRSGNWPRAKPVVHSQSAHRRLMEYIVSERFPR